MIYLAILALIVAQALACNPPAEHIKRMMAAEALQGFSTITKEHLASRELSRATGTWRPLKIYFDLRLLNTKLTEIGKASLIPFYEKVFSTSGAWWGSALKVNDVRSKILPLWKEFTKNDPTWVDPEGVDLTQYDLLVNVRWGEMAGNKSALAWAGPHQRHPDSQRPITGIVGVEKYGSDGWENYTDRKQAFKSAMNIMIHEFGHIIAFTSWETFLKDNVLTIQGTDGNKEFYWKGPKAIEIARKYYNCSGDFKGLPLSSHHGYIGGHQQEDWFGNEGMTPATDNSGADLFSGMTLALCEDSGWYQADYAMAENYEFGKGSGCDGKNCAKQTCDPQTDVRNTTDPKKTLWGYCSKDTNGCGVFKPYRHFNCKSATGWDKNDLSYGASYGDNCTVVFGMFFRRHDNGIYDTNTLSVEATCNADESEYSLKFKGAEYLAGDKKTGKDVIVACKAAGDVAYNELSTNVKSSVKCEDPKSFCKARFGGQELCPQMCSNSGRCANKANATTGPVDFKTLVSRKMLGGTRTIRLADSGSGSVGSNGWACWCFKNEGFSTDASGSCPDAL